VACLADYAARPTTAREHAAEIRHVYGFRDFSDAGASFRLVRWLYQRAWLSTEPPRVLFDLATAWLLEQYTSLRPTTLVTDSASYSDVVFALFMLLGYRFCPRLADLGDTRFYRINPTADYGALNGIARHRVNTELIARHWDDLLRVTGSLKLGTVSAHDLMHTFQGTGRHSSLARALAEYGRIGKTLHLLDLADDEVYRRDLLIQVNTGERRHGLARVVFQGRRGQLRQAYREGQEDQLGALGLVLNAIVVWNTRYMGLALNDLQKMGMPINPEDVERL